MKLGAAISLSCGREAKIVGLHCIRTINFLETGGVVTTMGSPTRWKRYVIEKAASRINALWGNRKCLFVHDAERDMFSLHGLPPWLFYVWLRCEQGISPGANGSRLVLIFFRKDIEPGIDEIVCEAVCSLDWTSQAEDEPNPEDI